MGSGSWATTMRVWILMAALTLISLSYGGQRNDKSNLDHESNDLGLLDKASLRKVRSASNKDPTKIQNKRKVSKINGRRRNGEKKKTNNSKKKESKIKGRKKSQNKPKVKNDKRRGLNNKENSFRKKMKLLKANQRNKKSSKEKARKKYEKLKNKKDKKKNIKNKGEQGQNRQDTGQCANCYETTKDVLFWEAYQVRNFLKQWERYSKFNKTNANKLGKRGRFDGPGTYLMQAADGNLANISCDYATSATSANSTNSTRSKSIAKSDFNSAYKMMTNCSKAVELACKRSDPDTYATAAECHKDMIKIKSEGDKCAKLDKDATAQCACWKKIDDDYKTPLQNKKCIGVMNKMMREMKAEKGKCLDAFRACKKKEDVLPKLVYECMSFDATKNWNKDAPVGVKLNEDSA